MIPPDDRRQRHAALTTLINAGLESLLPQLFDRILIPEEVKRELLVFHSGLPDGCEVRPVSAGDLLSDLMATIDAGEAEAIALAVESRATLLLIDDRKGRRKAESLGLTCLALRAVLTAARREELIPSLRDAFARIDAFGNYRVAEAAARVLLDSVGEE